MAGARKHGGHRNNIQVVCTAAGTAAVPDTFVYDAYAAQGPGSTANPTTGFDQTFEQITEMNMLLSSALTGQASNFTTFRVTHRNSAGSTVDQLTIVASAAAFVFVAFVPVNLAVANGATLPGGGTGTLTVAAGSALPWNLTTGDSVTLDTTVTGTGQYTGGVALNFLTQQKGA